MNYKTDAIYLRKSREDIELEKSGSGDTLERHRKALLDLAQRQQLQISHIYEEVVSGENIRDRPQMQALLSAVEQGCYSGVLCMEVDRLARGDTIDQGIVAQAFKYSNTKIITPAKTYDPSNEFDEEFFEFGLFMSRREYKTINRRLQRGRLASVKEGKWCGNKAPYGYRRIKLQGEKGFVLEQDPETAPVVQMIFDLFTGAENESLGGIARRLNDMGIKPATGGAHGWISCTIRDMLRNPAYAGFVRWNNRPQVKRVEAGNIITSRVRGGDTAVIYPGRHDGIISKEQYDIAQTRLAENRHTHQRTGSAMQNPLAGLVICPGCGRSMVRRPYQSGRQASLICPYADCKRKPIGSDLEVVEAAVLDGLRELVASIQVDYAAPDNTVMIDSLRQSLDALNKEIARLKAQQSKAYDLVEQGIYTTDVFLERSKALAAQLDALSPKQEEISTQLADLSAAAERYEQLVPTVLRVLDDYADADPAERNRLLKSIIDHIDYHKTQRERWGNGSDLAIIVHPRLP